MGEGELKKRLLDKYAVYPDMTDTVEKTLNEVLDEAKKEFPQPKSGKKATLKRMAFLSIQEREWFEKWFGKSE